jgi:uncharacterized protein YgiM (DUF1202 family)
MMRKAIIKPIIATFVILALLSVVLYAPTRASAATTTPQTSQLQQTGPYVTTNGAVNVRGGPGTGFYIKGILYLGEVVPVMGVSPDGGWWYVNTTFGSGWVSASEVTASNTSGVAVRNPGSIGTVTAGVLTVRGGAGPNAAALGQLRQGTQVFVLGRNDAGTWLQISWAYGTGWVSAAYMAVDGNVPGTGGGGADAVPVAPDAPYAIVNAAYLNLRSGPGVGYTLVGYLVGGDTVTIIGRSADNVWYQVQHTNGTTGWASGQYLITRNEFGGSPVTTDDLPNAELAAPVGIVNTGALNVRSGPGSQYTDIGTLAGGAEGTIIGRSADWAWWLMQSPVGTGWVSSRYIIVRGDKASIPYVAPGAAVPQAATGVQDGQGGANVTEEEPAAPQPELTGPMAFVATGRLNIRSGPNSVFSSLGSVSSTTRMPIIGQSPDRGWWYVESPFGNGWVSKLYVLAEGNTANVPVVQ